MPTPEVMIVPTDVNHYTFFGYMGIACALVLGNFGAAYGTAKSGVGVCSAFVVKPDGLFKSIVPIVMAGILGIYGLIIAVLFNGNIKKTDWTGLVALGTDPKAGGYTAYEGFKQLGGGLCCGMSSLAAGLAIGVVGDAAVRANAQREMIVGMILILIFAEALALYGFIIAIVVNLG